MADEKGITTAVERMNNDPSAEADLGSDAPAVEINDDTQAGEADATGALQDADLARAAGADPNQMIAPSEATATIANPTSSPAQEPASEPSARRAPTPELSDSLRPMDGATDASQREVENGQSYEIIYIVRPDQSEAPQQTSQRAREFIEGQGGAVDNIRTSEARRLAYTIKKQIEGVYVVINCRMAATSMPELDRLLKLEENVLRHMIIKE